MYKLVALDVDGTLLDRNHNLPSWNKEILEVLMQEGVRIALATGKPFLTVEALVRSLNLKSLQITNGGSSIVDPTTKEIVKEWLFPISLAKMIIKLTRSLGVSAVMVNSTSIIAEELNADTEYMETYGNPKPLIVERLEDALETGVANFTIVAYNNPELYEKTYVQLSKSFGGQLNIYKSSPFFIEVLSPGSSKGKALLYLSRHLGVRTNEIVCFGDNANDLSMFDVAGLSVAMGNADAEVKQKANLLTSTNDDCGVAEALVEIFKLTPEARP